MLLLQDGWTALHHACHYGQTEIAEHLLSNGANPLTIDKVSKLVNRILLKLLINLIIKCDNTLNTIIKVL